MTQATIQCRKACKCPAGPQRQGCAEPHPYTMMSCSALHIPDLHSQPTRKGCQRNPKGPKGGYKELPYHTAISHVVLWQHPAFWTLGPHSRILLSTLTPLVRPDTRAGRRADCGPSPGDQDGSGQPSSVAPRGTQPQTD